MLHGSGFSYGDKMRAGPDSPRITSTLLPRRSEASPFYFQSDRYLVFNEYEQGVVVSLQELANNPSRREARLLKAIEENDLEAIENYKLGIRILRSR